MTGWLRAVSVLLALSAVGASPQTPATASLSGSVVASSDGKPIRRVTVTLAGGAPAGSRVAVTDDQGQFTFRSLPAGRFTLTASRLGYVTAAYGATRGWRSPGVPIVIGQGQQIANLSLRMMKGGVITGRITDPLGQPIDNLEIGIGEQRTLNGQMTITGVPANGGSASHSGPTTETDDRGVYRLYGLPPGTFVVSAYRVNGEPSRTFEPTTSSDLDWAKSASGAAGQASLPTPPPIAPNVGYVPAYYPGTTDPAAAAPVALAAGEERTGIDFQIDPVRFSTIAGIVTGPSGEPVPGVTLFAVRVGAVTGGLSGGIPPNGWTDALGAFTIRGVPPGQFTILAQPRPLGAGSPAANARAVPSTPAAALFAKTDVAVDGADISGIKLQLVPGVTVSGRVVIESPARPLPADLLGARVRISAPPAPMGASIAVPPVGIAADGSFTIDGVGPGSYVLSVSLPSPEGWMVKSAVLGERDLMKGSLDVALGQPIEGVVVTLTDRVTEISGRLLDQANHPAPDYYVLAYPTDRRLWSLGRDRLRPAVRPDSTGRYRIVGLPPGEYYLSALTDIQPNDYADPSFLEMLVPASMKLTIGEGEKKSQDVKLVGGH